MNRGEARLARSVALRTCVGCRQTGDQEALIRVHKSPDGVSIGRGPGRGAYLHADRTCLELARKRRALERSLRATLPEELWTALGRIISPV